MLATITPISEKQGQRRYLPTFRGEVVQVNDDNAVIMKVATARDHHLPFVKSMTTSPNAWLAEFYSSRLVDLRWAIEQAEANLATYEAREQEFTDQARAMGGRR